MTMQCRICIHPKRLDIDREVIQGGNLSKMAKKFDLPYNSLYNHAQNHISRQLAQSWDKRQLAVDFDLLGRIDAIICRAEDIFKRNYDKQHDGLALKALDSQRNTIELLAKISYSLHQAKLTELELHKYETGEISEEQRRAESEMMEKQMEILTPEEQDLYLQILMKLESQDPSMQIVSDPNASFTFSHKEFDDKEEPRLKRTKRNTGYVDTTQEEITQETTRKMDKKKDKDNFSKPIPCIDTETDPEMKKYLHRQIYGF